MNWGRRVAGWFFAIAGPGATLTRRNRTGSDAVIVTAAPPEIPQPLIEQLKEGGRLVIPVGVLFQELKLIEKKNGRLEERNVIPVRFVPMIHGEDLD